MTPINVLSICVGISAYPESILEPGERPLKYLAQGAQDLRDLFASMWLSATSIHEVLVDEGATLARTREALARAAGPFDLRILYLAGHGRRGEGRPYEFLFFGDEPHIAVATARDIDGLLDLAGGDSVLLLLDSCFAGAFAEESAFFRGGVFQSGRVCIASCRSSQKSWEDDYFQQSLFCHAIVEALTAAPGETRQSMALTGGFFAQIASTVARHAFGLKASTAQEPVARASVTNVVMLMPSVTARPPRPSMTTHQILVRRIRQILVAVSGLSVMFVVALSVATWRPALNEHGYVELRAGPKWLSPLNVGPWRRRVETRVTSADLKNNALAGDIADEAGLYPWLGSNSARLRRWSDIFLQDYLNGQLAAAWSVRLGLEGAVESLTTTLPPGGGIGWRPPRLVAERVTTIDTATELAAEAKLLDPSRDLSDVWTVQWKANFVQGTCDESAISTQTADRLRLYLTMTEPAVFSKWLRGLALTAMADSAVSLTHVAQLVEMFRAANIVWRQDYSATLAAPGEPITAERIAFRFTERPSPAEQLALREVASATVERRLALGRPPVTNQERVRLTSLASACPEYATPILAALGADGDVPNVIAWSHDRKWSDQGRTVLFDLALRGVLPDAEIANVLDAQGFNADAASRKHAFASTREWLERMADIRGLPADLSNRLLNYADERLKMGDAAGARDVLAVVARSRAVSEDAILARMQSLIAEAVQPRPPLPPGEFEVELLGLLARSGAALTEKQRQALSDIMETRPDGEIPRVTFTERDATTSSKSMRLVAGLTSTHLLALSRAVLIRELLAPTLDEHQALIFLRTALVDSIRARASQESLREVVAAAAILAIRVSPERSTAKSISQDVNCCSGDAAARQTEVNIAVAKIALLPPSQHVKLLDDLRTLWRHEHEPEVRMALAEVVVRAVSEQSHWIRVARQ